MSDYTQHHMTHEKFSSGLANHVRKLDKSMKTKNEALWIIEQIVRVWQKEGRNSPVGMRVFFQERMLKSDAEMPRGMSLTRKVPGGSVSASVKREYALKKGLSKKKASEAFSLMVAIADTLFINRVDVYELRDHLPEWYSYCDRCNDGCQNFKGECDQ